MKQFHALAWLRWRLVLNYWRSKRSTADRMAALLSVALFATFSLFLGLASALFLSSLRSIPNGQKLFSAFGRVIFSVVFVGWILSSLRTNFGLLPTRNLVVFPLGVFRLSAFTLFSQLTTPLAMCFYPALIGFWAGALKLGELTPSSTSFWLVSVEMLAFVLLCATISEFLGNWLEIVLKRRSMISRLAWFTLGLAALGLLLLAVHPYFPGEFTPDGMERILHRFIASESGQYLPQGALVASIRHEVFHDGNEAGHFKTILSFFIVILIGNGLNIVVLKGNLRNDAVGKQKGRSRSHGIREKHRIGNLTFSDQGCAIFWKELKCLFISSLGRLSLSAALFLSLGSGLFHRQIISVLSSWSFLPTGLAESTSAFALLSFLNSLILFYPSNCFGFDGKGLTLFFVTPVPGRKVFFAKNMAWLVFAELTLGGVILIPVALKLVRFIQNPGLVLVSFQTYLLFILIFNNFLSVHFPMKLEVDQFRNATAGKSIPVILVTAVWVFTSLIPMLVMVLAWNFSRGVQYLIVGSGLGMAVMVYRKSLPFVERSLRRKKESLLQAVAWLN